MSEQYKSRVEKRHRSKKKKKQKKSGKEIAKKIFLALLVTGFITLVGGIGVVAYMVSDAPKLNIDQLKDPISSKIYDKDNNLIAELGTEKRDYVPFDEIPDLLVEAILATEDNRFFDHHGIDLIRLGGAIISNITDGFGSQGASTITQQVVKLSFLTPEKTIERKVQEAWLAYQLERTLSKEEIFEIYANKIHMGGSIYGVKKAAETYFGKELDELTLPEAALIAGLAQQPNAYNPFENPDLADKRKNTVLYLMNQHGYITEEEMKEAQNTPISSLTVENSEASSDNPAYDAFIDKVIDEVEALGYNVYTDGLDIYTTLDPSAQQKVYDLLNNQEGLFPDDKIQAGVVLLDTKTGEVRAIGGGRNITVRRAYNYATDIERQPGSTIKPILDYGPAIEYLKWSTGKILVDEPYSYPDGTPIRNWNNKFHGPVTIRTALSYSYNIPAVKALEAVGLEKAREFAINLGIPLPDTISESYALGGFKTGIAPIHLAGALAAFGNDGVYTEPHLIRKIVLGDGITEIKLTPESKQAMSPATAFMVTDILKGVLTHGYGKYAAVPGVPIAGKTGTTNYTEDEEKRFGITSGVPDSWFAGYSTNYTAAIWLGYPEKKDPVPESARIIPSKIFNALMTHVHQGVEISDFKKPDSVVKIALEKGTEKAPSPFTPEEQIIYEYAIKGYEPKDQSDKYMDVPEVKNLKAAFDDSKQEIQLSWDYNEIKDLQFEVYVSLDGGKEELLTTTDKKSVNIKDVQSGKYTFTVYAVFNEHKSKGVKAELDLTDLWDWFDFPWDKDDEDSKGNNDKGNNGNKGNNGKNKDNEDEPSDEDNSGEVDPGDGNQNDGENGGA